jgi:hypothetical protein
LQIKGQLPNAADFARWERRRRKVSRFREEMYGKRQVETRGRRPAHLTIPANTALYTLDDA